MNKIHIEEINIYTTIKMNNNTNNQLVFDCNITKYYIEFILNNDKAYMNTINWDYLNIKPFLQLIRTAIEKLKKNNHIKKIVQTISLVDWDNFVNKNTTFEIINKDNKLQICDIQCDIEDFLENFGIILGINDNIVC